MGHKIGMILEANQGGSHIPYSCPKTIVIAKITAHGLLDIIDVIVLESVNTNVQIGDKYTMSSSFLEKYYIEINNDL